MNKVLAILCLGAIVVFGSCKRETKDEKFKRECEQFTQKECPMEMVSGVRLDSVCYDIKSRTRSEYYTIEGDFDKNSEYVKQILASLHESILKELKSSLQLKSYKDEGIAFRYAYMNSTTGQCLFDLTFTPEDYGK